MCCSAPVGRLRAISEPSIRQWKHPPHMLLICQVCSSGVVKSIVGGRGGGEGEGGEEGKREGDISCDR